MEKPKDIEGFKIWYEKKFNSKIDQPKKNYYDQVTQALKQQISTSNFWTGFTDELKELSHEYLLTTQYEFMASAIQTPELYLKPFNSYIDKLFRKNVIDNKNWPECPEGGWYKVESSYNRIKDLVRTSFVVKYLDGVELLATKLERFGAQTGNNIVVSFEAREHGYYAAHLDVGFQLEIPKMSWETEAIYCSFEIQITTQLQEVLKKLTHQYYETRRLDLGTNEQNKKWQWDYKSEEFTANYLGHILHYLEGMILEVRDRRK
ncbi:hypothetical protein [Paenibacillus planticolens]|uniref:RelA/SpoT domain-containing protein n=1 Tax=Paenibacillus planticolens TaxID=2654976 RepID=A0ABX1ZQZ5_9BACL|nr:hypothetical protein [Paenibacillus planticolens]NOV01327.1 hypothetical protein [Paenibacillus planticolens]